MEHGNDSDAGDAVAISVASSDVSINVAATVASITIGSSSATLNIENDGSPVDVTGSFTNSGTFGLHDDTALATISGGFANSGTLNVDNNYSPSFGVAEGGSSLTITGHARQQRDGADRRHLCCRRASRRGDDGDAGRADQCERRELQVVWLGELRGDAGVQRRAAWFTSNAGDFEMTYGGPLTLSSAFANTGTFGIHDNTSVTVQGGFTNAASSSLNVDNNYSPSFGVAEGGSSLTIMARSPTAARCRSATFMLSASISTRRRR